MNAEQLTSHVASLTGHLHTTDASDEIALKDLQHTIADTALQQNAATIRNRELSFESSDLFFEQNIAAGRFNNIQAISKNALERQRDENEPSLRMFVRDMPMRTSQVAGSVPDWAAGAHLEKSYGPFMDAEGRLKWFDFYRVEKLLAIYVQGQSLPSILFKARLRSRIFQIDHEISNHYYIIEGSVWIRASLLSPSAPADKYCGLKVREGSVDLDTAPQLIDDKLVIQNNNNVRVTLGLVQQELGEQGAGRYGADARNADYRLPSAFLFSFQGLNKTLLQISSAAWKVYGNGYNFDYQGNQTVQYEPLLSKALISMNVEQREFEILDCGSPFCTMSGKAKITKGFWALPAATLDIANPLAADGSGALLVQCGKGLRSTWKTIDGNDTALTAPVVFGEPGRIAITDILSNALGATQHIDLWKDDQNTHGTSVDITYNAAAPFMFNTLSKGDEALLIFCNTVVNADRPVKVNGEAVSVRSNSSAALFATNDTRNIFYLLDDNLLWDNKMPFEKVPFIKPISLALENALFTVSPPNGVALFGNCNNSFTKMNEGVMLLSFGMFSYLPTLPDPYIANLGALRRQFFRGRDNLAASSNAATMWLWLVCFIKFKPKTQDRDDVKVSFHFGSPPQQQSASVADDNVGAGKYNGIKSTVGSEIFAQEKAYSKQLTTRHDALRVNENELVANVAGANEATTPNVEMQAMMYKSKEPRNYQNDWDDRFGQFQNDFFALLDVSSNANQFGVSFGMFGSTRYAMMQTAQAVAGQAQGDFPLQVQEMQVVSRGTNVRAFTLPLVAWEPVFNLTFIEKPQLMDPPFLWNYYPDDGGPTRIFNNSGDFVPLAPIPLVKFLIEEYKNNPKNKTIASFTLPFGLRAIAAISGNGEESTKPTLDNLRPEFKNDKSAKDSEDNKLIGGIQIKSWAGNYDIQSEINEAEKKDSRMFPGYTAQMNNIVGMSGNPTLASTLGDSVTNIFNNEFFDQPYTSKIPVDGRGVPVTRIDFTGYGANMFSNWLSPSAEFAATSQARFDVMLGRTAHEVIQVKSVLYPWGIRVVRTITLFRVSSGYVYRVDSGWKAESAGKFDFRFHYKDLVNPPYTNIVEETPYQIHPGVLKGLFNVQNIKEDRDVADFPAIVKVNPGDEYINIKGEKEKFSGAAFDEQVLCRPVWFDCDVEIENAVVGHTNSLVPAKKVLGYVQLAPIGKPLTAVQLRDLINTQFGSIGGPVNCVVDINKSNQQMRINRFDINVSVDETGGIAFVAAARGNVFLPKDGSWSMVQHSVGTGEVTPLAESVTVPLTRKGKWVKETVINQADVDNNIISITNPLDLLRAVNPQTINFGFLQSTATQKALFLTPSYKKGVEMLMSKTPPIFADAYRLMSGNGIFPNVGNAVNNFGKNVPLLTANNVAAFTERALADGTKVFELLKVEAEKTGAEVIKQGMSLLQKGIGGVVDKALHFDIPDLEIPLVEMDGLKIYIDYKTKKEKSGAQLSNSKVNFDVNSFAGTAADQWKGRMNNVSMVVDLGSIKRMMIIKGNFEARKGQEAGYGGDTGGLGGLPTPELEFNEKLQPVIDLLQMLAELSTGNYAAALKRGMKVAMSNSGEIWQYKFEASKTIPLLRFPPVDAIYNDPNCPLKLDASLGVGVYFNAALKVTTDPKQLLPTAGAFLQFHGSLSVMCVSLSVATVYAVGAVDVRIACDTQKGPSLLLKFGFGAQIVVGLPVVGNVSVLYMIGVEIYAGTDKISLAGFMLFRGHAELLAGLVSVTITIEAKGIIERTGDETNCTASVTFAIDISIFLIIDISFSKTWGETRQIA